jgi:hypothetical protein
VPNPISGGSTFFSTWAPESLTFPTKARIIFDYHDIDNFSCVEWQHVIGAERVAVIQRLSGVETELSSRQMVRTGGHGGGRWLAMLSKTSILAWSGDLGDSGWIFATVPKITSRYFGIGTGDVVTTQLALSSAVATQTNTGVETSCRTICRTSNYLIPPQEITITLAGIVDNSCADCTTVNGSYVVPLQIPGTGETYNSAAADELTPYHLEWSFLTSWRAVFTHSVDCTSTGGGVGDNLTITATLEWLHAAAAVAATIRWTITVLIDRSGSSFSRFIYILTTTDTTLNPFNFDFAGSLDIPFSSQTLSGSVPPCTTSSPTCAITV